MFNDEDKRTTPVAEEEIPLQELEELFKGKQPESPQDEEIDRLLKELDIDLPEEIKKEFEKA